jgi:hypothetical protein
VIGKPELFLDADLELHVTVADHLAAVGDAQTVGIDGFLDLCQCAAATATATPATNTCLMRSLMNFARCQLVKAYHFRTKVGCPEEAGSPLYVKAGESKGAGWTVETCALRASESHQIASPATSYIATVEILSMLDTLASCDASSSTCC